MSDDTKIHISNSEIHEHFQRYNDLWSEECSIKNVVYDHTSKLSGQRKSSDDLQIDWVYLIQNQQVMKWFHQFIVCNPRLSETENYPCLDIGSQIEFISSMASLANYVIVDPSIQPRGYDMDAEECRMRFVSLEAQDMHHFPDGVFSWVTSLHAIEHFGLGRYGDSIDIEGHIKGISNLIKMIIKGGTLYISFPIGASDEVHFNAHRVFHPKSIFSYQEVKEKLELINFDYVDDKGDLHLQASVDSVDRKLKYGCGIYTFKRL